MNSNLKKIALIFALGISANSYAADPISNELNLFSQSMGNKVKAYSITPTMDSNQRAQLFEKMALKAGIDETNAKNQIEEAKTSATWNMPDMPFTHWMIAKNGKNSICLISADPSIEKRPSSTKSDMEKRANELRSMFSCLLGADSSYSELYGKALLTDMDKANRASDIASMTFAAAVILADGKDKAQNVLADKEFVSNNIKSYNAKDGDVKKALESAKKIIWMAGWGEAGKSKIMNAVMKKLNSDLASLAKESENQFK